MKRLLTLTLCLASLTLGGQVFAAKVYKWVDEDGTTHFSEHPPKNTQTTVIKPKIGHSEPVNYESSGAPTDKNAADTAAEQKARDEMAQALKDPIRCEAARKNMETLRNFGRVKVKADDGSYQFLTPDEQQKRMQTTQDAINESC